MFEECLLTFCILGGTPVWTYENIALNKTAWQQGTLLNFNAARAVDGRKDSLSIFGSDCVTSQYNFTAEWRVDLEAVVSIHHIFIQYATNNLPWDKNNIHTSRFLGFSVYISNTTNKEDGILCFRDTKYTRATIPNPTNITCPYYGRYVIYYNNRTHYPYPVGYSKDAGNDLCEVEVYGCITPVYYGENCSSLCPKNCQDGRCHIKEETCLKGADGCSGLNCSEVSDLNRVEHRENCSTPCAENCLDGSCNIVNGTCFGCLEGYSEPKSSEGESSTTWINNGNSTTTTWMDVEETKAYYASLYLCGAVGVVVLAVIITIFVLKTGNSNSAKTSHSCCLNTSRGNARFSQEEEIALQNVSTQMMQVHSGYHYSNGNIYSEPFERTENCREVQSRCSFGDQDNETNVYSYNHLHEKPIQTFEDVYDVANPIFQPSAP